MVTGLCLSIIHAARTMSGNARKEIFGAKDDHQLNQIMNLLFRPDIKVPCFLITDNFQKSSAIQIMTKKLQTPGLSDAAKVQLLTGMDPYGIPELK